MPLRALFQRRQPELKTIDIAFEQNVYLVRLVRHAQARRYTLRIQSATREAVLTMPRRGSLKDARAFAEKNGAWIAARLSRLPESVSLHHGATVPLRGIMHRIDHRRSSRGTVWGECGDDGANLLCVAGDAPHVERRLVDFFRREAKRDLERASRTYASKLGVAIRRITVRDQTSRWGSCSTTGVLSYSWRLVRARRFVLEYLAAHEVAHLVEMNHSRRFWRLLLGMNPDVHRAKSWLDAHGAELHRYGS